MGQVYVQEVNSIMSVPQLSSHTTTMSLPQLVPDVNSSHTVGLHRLLNNRMLQLQRQLMASSQDRSLPAVKRKLFGPVDHGLNLKFAQEEMAKMQQADCKRWNFDFQEEKPKDGEFTWHSVPLENDTPGFTCHTTTTSTCLTTTTTTCSPTTTTTTCLDISGPTTCPSSTYSTPSHSNSQVSPTNNRGLKRLQGKPPIKVAKRLCTDYFPEVKSSRHLERSKLKVSSELFDGSKCVNTKLSEMLKVKSTNMQ